MEFHWRNWNQRRDDHGELQRSESIKPYAYAHINTYVYSNVNAYADCNSYAFSDCHANAYPGSVCNTIRYPHVNTYVYTNGDGHSDCNPATVTDLNADDCAYSHRDRNAYPDASIDWINLQRGNAVC